MLTLYHKKAEGKLMYKSHQYNTLRLHKHKLDNGKMFFAIVDEYQFPGIERTLFISQKYADVATSSVETCLYDLIFFLRCMVLCGFELDEQMSCGILPPRLIIKRFVEAAGMSQNDAFEYITVKTSPGNKVKSLNLSDRQISNALSKSNKRKLVRVKTKNDRIDAAIAYTEFLYNHHVKRPTVQNEKDIALVLSDLEMARGRPGRSSIRAAVVKGLEFEEVLAITKKIAPFSPDNPFKSAKWRNSLLLLLYAFSGLRRGSVAKLKISNLDLTGNADTIRITRTPNDVEDPRHNPPSQKTREHLAVIPAELMAEIKDYYDYTRKRFPESSKHTFIFVTEKNTAKSQAGSPISLSTHNAILSRISEAFGVHLHPHRLRHSYASLLEKLAEKSSWTDEQTWNVHNEQHGWAVGSQMRLLYARLQTLKKMHETSRQHGSEIFKNREKIAKEKINIDAADSINRGEA